MWITPVQKDLKYWHKNNQIKYKNMTNYPQIYSTNISYFTRNALITHHNTNKLLKNK